MWPESLLHLSSEEKRLFTDLKLWLKTKGALAKGSNIFFSLKTALHVLFIL